MTEDTTTLPIRAAGFRLVPTLTVEPDTTTAGLLRNAYRLNPPPHVHNVPQQRSGVHPGYSVLRRICDEHGAQVGIDDLLDVHDYLTAVYGAYRELWAAHDRAARRSASTDDERRTSRDAAAMLHDHATDAHEAMSTVANAINAWKALDDIAFTPQEDLV